MFVTTAKPGSVNVYDALRNFGCCGSVLSDGSVTVIDVAKGEPIASMDTLKNQGFNPNCIVLLPDKQTQRR